MANSSSEDETDTLPERPTRIQLYQFEPVRQDFERVPEHRVSFKAKPHAVFHGVCEIALTEVFATQMGMMRHSKTVWLWMCCGHLHAEADVIQHFLRSLLVSELFLLF